MKSTDIKGTKLDKLNKEITNYWHIIRTGEYYRKWDEASL